VPDRLAAPLLAATGTIAVAFEFLIGFPGTAAGIIGVVLTGASVAIYTRTLRRVERERSQSVERLRTESAELDAQLSLQAAILSSLSIGIVAYDRGNAIFSNEQARSELGDRLENVNSVAPISLRWAIEQASTSGEVHTARFEVDYPPRVIEARAHALAPEGVVVVRLVDVTDEHRIELVRRDFVAAASHELKTPVAAIQAAAETVLMAIDDDVEAAKDFSRRVRDNAVRLARIVSDLLDLSRLETATPVTEPLDLGKVVAEEVDQLSGASDRVAVVTDSVVVDGNAGDIALAVRNLLENAIRYTGEGGEIAVSVTDSGGEAVIEVRDTGVGIPQQALPRIFERFYRVDAARSRATGGTGLGLAIVKHVADQHGGRAEAASVLGQGSTLRIIIPIYRSDTDSPGRVAP